jgi:hypothetical protein
MKNLIILITLALLVSVCNILHYKRSGTLSSPSTHINIDGKQISLNVTAIHIHTNETGGAEFDVHYVIGERN